MLDLRITATTIEVMHKGKRVTSHARHGQGRYSTETAHMPKSHQAHRERSPGRFLNWAADIGPCTAQVVRQQPEDRPHPEYRYRACPGLLRLARRYDRTRLEKAWEQQREQPQTHDLSFDERLALLVEREVLHRENRRLARLPRPPGSVSTPVSRTSTTVIPGGWKNPAWRRWRVVIGSTSR